MARPATKSELARIAGVSPAAVTKQTKGNLAPACKGGRIDLDHPVVVEWLASKGVSAPKAANPDEPKTKPKEKTARKTKQPTESGPEGPKPAPRRSASRRGSDFIDPDSPEFIDRYGHLTHAQLMRRFGTSRGLRDVMDALKSREDIRGKRTANDEADGKLISRELVKTHVFGAIEAGNRRLLRDLPRTITRRCYGNARSGVELEVSEELVRELIGSVLGPVKSALSQVLREDNERSEPDEEADE